MTESTAHHRQPVPRVCLYFYVAFALLLVYWYQDFLTSQNVTGLAGLSRVGVHISLFAIILLLGFYYALSLTRGIAAKSPVRRILWLIVCWILAANLLNGTFTWLMLVQFGLSLLWVLAFHLASDYLRRVPDAGALVHVGMMAVLLLNGIAFLYATNAIRTLYSSAIVLNLSYSLLVFLPWLALIRRRLIRYSLFGVVFAALLVSMKRGAILAFPLMVAAAIWADARVRNVRLARLAIKALPVIVMLIVGLLVADQWMGGLILGRFNVVQIADSAGSVSIRFQIYRTLLDELSDGSFAKLLIGHGSGAVERIVGMAAHNEWLQFLFSFGIVGFLLYGAFLVTLTRRLMLLIRVASPYAAGYAMALVYIAAVGLFGQIFFAHSTLYIMIFAGAADGLLHHIGTPGKQQRLDATGS